MDGSLKNFILARNFQSRSKSRIFLIFGPSGFLGGGLPRKGVGAKKFDVFLKPGKPNFLGGISRRRPKSLRKNRSRSILALRSQGLPTEAKIGKSGK